MAHAARRVETPTRRSWRTYQKTGAEEQKCLIPTAHFMAFIGAGAAAFRMAIVATNACLVAFRTAFMAFIGAGAAAFRMAFVATKVCSLASLLTAFIAFMAAARIAFVGTIACLVAFRT